MQERQGDQTPRVTLGNTEESDVHGTQKGTAVLLRVTEEKQVSAGH